MSLSLYTDFTPKANHDSIIQVGPLRFTVLTPRLIRMEFNPTENFEDRASQVFWYRKQAAVSYTKSETKDKVTIQTSHLNLTCDVERSVHSFHDLQIQLKKSGFIWHYGQENNTNLGGTVRTLDNVNGAISLDPGLVSSTGWSVVDDSHSLVFREDGWLVPRNAHPAAKDLYFFGYGRDFTACVQDFQKISGQVPLLPRFTLGNWWSRYWPYTQEELIALMDDFSERQVPLSVCIIDMDWHIVETGNESSGWTGYTWNPKMFPEPKKFLDELNNRGLKKALNLHPAAGVYPHEMQYKAMAEQLNMDPLSEEPVPFQISDPDFSDAYFNILHHPLEEMGVDFWWIDWQQGTKTEIEALDPLYWLNHLHFYDIARNGEKRPFIFSRYAGLGSHRYPIGFSGDTMVTWEMLQFLPYFTATAANVGYGWWSHDIGGHMGGIEEAELYLRWVQYGVFSPILRVHSTNNPYHERRPWGFDAQTEAYASAAFQLRHALIPYIYTAAWQNYKNGILPIRPMYHIHPDEIDAYQYPNEYTFGSELIACPFTTPRDPETRLSRQVIWLPEGDWFDFTIGEYYEGGGWYAFYGGLDQIPVFAKAGAIVPLAASTGTNSVDLPKSLTIHVFPGADNTYQFYEDDGETNDYKHGIYATREMSQIQHENKTQFLIRPISGDSSFLPPERTCSVIFHALLPPESLKTEVDGHEFSGSYEYNKDKHQLVVKNLPYASSSELSIEIIASEPGFYRKDLRYDNINTMLKVFKLNSYTKQQLAIQLNDLVLNPLLLVPYADRMKHSHLLALAETLMGKQRLKISDDPDTAYQSLVNKILHL